MLLLRFPRFANKDGAERCFDLPLAVAQNIGFDSAESLAAEQFAVVVSAYIEELGRRASEHASEGTAIMSDRQRLFSLTADSFHRDLTLAVNARVPASHQP